MDDYIPEDQESCGYASLIVWLNPDYRADQSLNAPKDINL
jgi:hypothetical protein